MRNPHLLAAQLLELFARRALSEPMLSDLTPGQWAALRRLGASAGKGCSTRQIARALDVDTGSADRCIAALQQKGFVAATCEDSSDRTRLTEAGRLRLRDDPLAWIDGALIRLPPQDKLELCRMLTILLDAQAMDAPARRREILEHEEHLAG